MYDTLQALHVHVGLHCTTVINNADARGNAVVNSVGMHVQDLVMTLYMYSILLLETIPERCI